MLPMTVAIIIGLGVFLSLASAGACWMMASTQPVYRVGGRSYTYSVTAHVLSGLLLGPVGYLVSAGYINAYHPGGVPRQPRRAGVPSPHLMPTMKAHSKGSRRR